MKSKYVVEINDKKRKFTDFDKALEYYNQCLNKHLFSGKLINTTFNTIVCEFCNDKES